MTDEICSESPVANIAPGHSSDSGLKPFDSVQFAGVSVLLEQCRGDLDLVERILGKLESPVSHVVQSLPEKLVRGNEQDLIREPEEVDPKSAGYEAETVRRLAHHIENLCRFAQSEGVEEMLEELQAKMVRCLRLIPANRAHAKAS